MKYTTDDFISKATERHGDRYDYSLVDYISSNLKVKIICKEHGVFEQRPTMHIQGAGCPACWNIRLNEGVSKGRKPIKGNKEHKCPKCGHVFPRNSKYFWKNARVSDGMSCYCKGCSDNKTKQWCEDHTEEVKNMRHDLYERMKGIGKRRKYKIARYIKEGKLPADFVDPNPNATNLKLISKSI